MKYFARMKLFTMMGSSIMVLIVLVAAVSISKKLEVPQKRLEIVLRDMGHKLLLTAGDSTSRVLPVKKVDENRYQIAFQKDFSFVSDTLINLVQREFQKNVPATSYIVSLINCKQNETVFAFEINNKTGDLTPCRGRKLETACYVIEIELLKGNTFNSVRLLLLIIPLALIGLYAKNRFRKKAAVESIADTSDYIQLGSCRFYADKNVLKTGDKTIELSEKETKALKIFAENSNQIVEREKLMKEIWEDNGIVVISRNVDVLVSKLRKKLSHDNSIKFINVPGRGYKFVIE